MLLFDLQLSTSISSSRDGGSTSIEEVSVSDGKVRRSVGGELGSSNPTITSGDIRSKNS